MRTMLTRRQVLIVSILFICLAITIGCISNDIPTAPTFLPTTEMTPPPGIMTPAFFSSLHNMQGAFAPEITLALPYYLPSGYVFSQGSYSTQHGGREVIYARGEELILFVQGSPSGRPFDLEVDGVVENTMVDSTPAIFILGAERNQLRWGRYNLSFWLTGKLSEEEMLGIAESVRLAPYDEQMIPPYDYVPPANPLIAKITVNQTVLTNNITVTLISVDCSTDTCKAELRVNLPSVPVLPGTPDASGASEPLSVPPQPHGEIWTDNDCPVRIDPYTAYQPEDGTTFLFWSFDPISSKARVLHIRIDRFKEYLEEIGGPWEFTVLLER
jgi:hypothetical protein